MYEVKPFPFYIMYFDVRRYISSLKKAYGEDSACVQAFNKTDFMDRLGCPVKYAVDADELLLDIRKFLVESGFEKEVEAQDKVFAEERSDRGKEHAYIPMHERWKMDEEMWKKMEKNKKAP